MLEFILAESCFTTLESCFGSPVAMMLFADWSRRTLVYYSLGPFLVFYRWNTHVTKGIINMAMLRVMIGNIFLFINRLSFKRLRMWQVLS